MLFAIHFAITYMCKTWFKISAVMWGEGSGTSDLMLHIDLSQTTSDIIYALAL